jgi:signal transduction histidine kinase
LGEVPADAAMVKQVIINLVKNALEAMESRESGTLSVATLRGNGGAEVMIGDTGSGMAPETVEQLFSPYFTTKIGGVGLGLSVSRRIIAQHGGRIEVDSKLGAGSTFTVTLPLSESAETQESQGVASKTQG